MAAFPGGRRTAMPDRVEAEGEEANGFLSALRDILKVPKSEIDAKVARARSKVRKGLRERKNGSSTPNPKG